MEQAQSQTEQTPAELWNEEAAKRALDELFTSVRRYTSSGEFTELVSFTRRFKQFSPFNALLIHMQMPGARYVLRASDWRKRFGRTVVPGARPLVVLQPMGPVMFLYDLSDTEGKEVPQQILKPFQPKGRAIGTELEKTLANCARDGVRVHLRDQGSQAAGSIQVAANPGSISVLFREKFVPVRYELILNQKLNREERYATLVHELGHLYCGHLGTPKRTWWPDRRGLDDATAEFEAEAVCYLVCDRLGIKNPSAKYLQGYLKANGELPGISLERVFVTIGLIEQMGKRRLALR